MEFKNRKRDSVILASLLLMWLLLLPTLQSPGESLAVSASSHLRSVIVRVDQIFQATDLAANALLARAQKVRELYGIANGPFI